MPSAEEIAEACKPQPYRPAPPVPVSPETYERLRDLIRSDLDEIYRRTPPSRMVGTTAELVDDVVEIRDSGGHLLAIANPEAFEKICERFSS